MGSEMAYESGFQWVFRHALPGDREGDRWNLLAPSGRAAATVFTFDNPGYTWFVWDERGCGGENSLEPTIEAAKIAAESAVLRWGKHTRHTNLRAQLAAVTAERDRLREALSRLLADYRATGRYPSPRLCDLAGAALALPTTTPQVEYLEGICPATPTTEKGETP